MAFPSSAWKYVPSSGVPNPPRWPPPRTGRRAVFPEPASGARWVARHWLKLESAGACSGRASGSVPGARSGGFASRWAPRGPIGVLVWAAFSPFQYGEERARRSLVGGSPRRCGPSGHHRPSPFASACPASEPGTVRGARRREVAPRGRSLPFRRRASATEPPPSNGARLPAELKHITKRRKRNQQGCP